MVLAFFCVKILHMFLTFRNTNGVKSESFPVFHNCFAGLVFIYFCSCKIVAQLGEAIIEISYSFLIRDNITEAIFQPENLRFGSFGVPGLFDEVPLISFCI